MRYTDREETIKVRQDEGCSPYVLCYADVLQAVSVLLLPASNLPLIPKTARPKHCSTATEEREGQDKTKGKNLNLPL
jgi:hypothetical protein